LPTLSPILRRSPGKSVHLELQSLTIPLLDSIVDIAIATVPPGPLIIDVRHSLEEALLCQSNLCGLVTCRSDVLFISRFVYSSS
jgi:hypothetical protein